MNTELIDLVEKSNDYFKNSEYEQALELCETVYQKLPVDTVEQKRLTYNKAVLYIKLEKPDEAKKCLDSVIDEAFIFPILENLAILYETLAILFTIKYTEKTKYKLISECYELSCIYYAKCKKWVEYCINGLENSRILAENGHKKESIIIADKILSVSLYLNIDNKLEPEKVLNIKILNNLGVIYSKDELSKHSSIIAFKLFKRILDLNLVDENLNLVMYSNSSALRNKMGLKKQRKFQFESKILSEINVCFKFNLAYSSFLSEAYQKSIKKFEEAFKLASSITLKDKEVKSEIKESLGTCLCKLFKYQEAKSCFEEALNLTQSEKSKSRLKTKISKCEYIDAELNARSVSDARSEPECPASEESDKLDTDVLEFKKMIEIADAEQYSLENTLDSIDKKSSFSVKDMNSFIKSLNQDTTQIITAVDLKNTTQEIVREQSVPRLYSSPNNGTAIDHPEDKPIQTKSFTLCLIM